MFSTSFVLNKFFKLCRLAACVVVGALIVGQAHADTTSLVAPYALQQALATNERVDLPTLGSKGFNIDSSYYTGSASGVTAPDGFADFNNQQLYALLIDGRYDFNYENQNISSPIHPYVMGGMGMATTGHLGLADSSGTSVLPMFRLGGGVAYRLDPKWNLSLDYKAGVATQTSGDQLFTGRSQQSVDLQTLNLGMSYAF